LNWLTPYFFKLMKVKHVFSDGSKLYIMSAQQLCEINIWHGNRLLNEQHKNEIATAIVGNIHAFENKPFHIVKIKERSETGETISMQYIVDGQHRVNIMKSVFDSNPFTDDFEVMVIEKTCSSEREISHYFKTLNNTKPIDYKEDPKLIANEYVNAIQSRFGTTLIKSVRTRAPYLCAESLRNEFIKRRVGCGISDLDPEQYADAVFQKNAMLLDLHKESQDERTKRMLAIKFMLSMDWNWLTP